MAATSSASEFSFTPAEFRRVRQLIHRHAGISLADSKQEMVYSRLIRRLKAMGMPTFSAYLDHLEAGDAAELEQFSNALTTNLTSFFREPHHFPLLAEHARAHTGQGPYRVWCCAASTGEEPYSIAITLAEVFGSPKAPVQILATDIDTEVLRVAEQGVYDAARVAPLEPAQLQQFFLKGRGAQAGRVRVRPELASLITFRPLNLQAHDWRTLQPFDAIFCRNVMIYFDKPTQYEVLRKFAPLLKRDGLLFAGHSEAFFHAADLFRLRGRTVYEKAAAS